MRRRPWPLLKIQSVAAFHTFHGSPACHWSFHESPPEITQKKKRLLAMTISRIDLRMQDSQMLERVQNKTRDATCAAERVAEVTLHQWSLAPPARSAPRFYFWILGVLDAACRHGNGALVPVKIEVAASRALLFGQPRRLVCLLQHLIRSFCYTTSTTARPTKSGSFPSAHMPDICLALRRISPRQTLQKVIHGRHYQPSASRRGWRRRVCRRLIGAHGGAEAHQQLQSSRGSLQGMGTAFQRMRWVTSMGIPWSSSGAEQPSNQTVTTTVCRLT